MLEHHLHLLTLVTLYASFIATASGFRTNITVDLTNTYFAILYLMQQELQQQQEFGSEKMEHNTNMVYCSRYSAPTNWSANLRNNANATQCI